MSIQYFNYFIIKRLYDVQLEDVEQSGDGVYIESQFFIEKYNHTLNVLNGKISLLQDIPITTTVSKSLVLKKTALKIIL